MKAPLFLVAIAALALTACGGGGAGSSYGGGGGGGTTTPPVTAPASQPALGTATISGQSKQTYTSSSNGHTLYTFGADTSGVSNCTSASGCTAAWPPYTAPAGTSASTLGAGFSLITRSDGSLQYAYQGWALYTYAGDSASGQANGQGLTQFGGTWAAAQPASGGTTNPGGCIGYYC